MPAAEYRTVGGVSGPLVIVEHVKVLFPPFPWITSHRLTHTPERCTTVCDRAMPAMRRPGRPPKPLFQQPRPWNPGGSCRAHPLSQHPLLLPIFDLGEYARTAHSSPRPCKTHVLSTFQGFVAIMSADRKAPAVPTAGGALHVSRMSDAPPVASVLERANLERRASTAPGPFTGAAGACRRNPCSRRSWS